MSRIQIRRALLSVSDKSGLVEFAADLVAAGVEIIASGGTAKTLRSAGFSVTPVDDVTGSAEMLDGRVKTLHPRIHGAILADLGNTDHRKQLYELDLAPIQLVVVNLYPFEEGVDRPDITANEAIELIDIGGPTLLRAAAKNHRWVGVVTSPDQYPAVTQAIAAGGLDDEFRRELARAAFFRTAEYDAAIVGWLEGGSEQLPRRMVLTFDRSAELRYGENPHQRAGLYAERGRESWWGGMTQLQGKDMSFNNYLDTEAAWRLADDFAEPTVVIVKHANPCGVASRDSIEEAFTAAWECDPVSAFGGVIAVNRPIDESTARIIANNFAEVLIAPAVDEAAAGILSTRRNLRVLTATPPAGDDLDVRRIDQGFVVQHRDRLDLAKPGNLPAGWESVGERPLDSDALTDLRIAWTVAAHTKSNAIVIVRDRAAVGIGAGDQSRVGAAQRALRQAGDRARGAVAASDGFFPFRDGVDLLGGAGVVAVVEPGGSMRDDEVVKAADQNHMAIVFTGMRHFRH